MWPPVLAFWRRSAYRLVLGSSRLMRWLGVLAVVAMGCGDDAAQADAAEPDAAEPDAAVDAAVDAAPDGPFISSSAETLIESETHVAADGAGNVVAAWIGIRSASTSNGYAISHDEAE